MEIAFLIRIKEGVRPPGLECEAFAASASDAICAECGEELILAPSVVRFNTDFCGSCSSVRAQDLTLSTALKELLQ